MACMGQKKSAQYFVQIPEGKRLPVKPRCRQDNIKMDFPSISCLSTPVILNKFFVMSLCVVIKKEEENHSK